MFVLWSVCVLEKNFIEYLRLMNLGVMFDVGDGCLVKVQVGYQIVGLVVVFVIVVFGGIVIGNSVFLFFYFLYRKGDELIKI